jgi:hypothetical protein
MMSEQSLPHLWLGRSLSVALTLVLVAGALAFALS